MKKCFLAFVLFYSSSLLLHAQPIQQVDVVVYGATSGGVIAAYTAKKLGKSVLLIEPGRYVGGLTTGGLGYTDIGNKYAITGLSRDFYRRIGAHYGKLEQWIFEPHVATLTFQHYIDEANLIIAFEHRLVSVNKQDGSIKNIVIESSVKPGKAGYKIIKATMFIDCSYEGDLMAKAGVSYFTGREDNSLFNETYNGVQLRDKHQFPDGISPYKIPGDSASGLLWGISNQSLLPRGSGDKKIQTYNFRLCLTNNLANKIEVTKPSNYDAAKYELLLRVIEKTQPKTLDSFIKIDVMPNSKTDINNNGPFSTDMIGMNYEFAEADYTNRSRIQKAHEDYVKGLLYFIGHDERMPKHLREMMLQWGYPKDEYTTNGNWSPQMYVREVRRMNGMYVMTQANCEAKEIVDDGVGMAAYTMDSHNCQRLVINGMVKNEGDVQVGGFGPYPIAYRAIIPKAGECKNLLVPVCLSASHIAYGSIRMEPVFMVLSQSAAVAAVMAIDAKQDVQQVDVKQLQHTLKVNPLADNEIAEILVDNDDVNYVKIIGQWNKEKRGSYGPSMFIDDGKSGMEKEIRFSPQVLTAGNYKVYAYFPKMPDASAQTFINLFDGSNSKEVIVKDSDIRVEGQTAGEWVGLGSMTLPKGNKAFVNITNKQANGAIIADAILFVPMK